MTRKDFELIAKLIRTAPLQRPQRQALAEQSAATLSVEYARFDSSRFITACMA